MAAVDPRFTRAEYDRRIAKTRAAMDGRGIELLIVTDPSNMAWLTGYDGWSFYVHQCVLLAPDGEPLWYGRGQDANGAKRTVFMADDQIIGYPDHYVQSTERHPMDYLAGILESRGWGRRRIGVEMDNYYFSAACLGALERHLPNATFVDATGLVNWQRAVKSAAELEYMRRAARIVEAMHARILELVEPGLPKHELVAEIFRTGIRGADGHGGDYPAIVPLVPSGADASAAHLTWDERPFRKDEGTFFEIAGCYRRYHCPLSRTVYLGQAAAEVPRRRAGGDRGHRRRPRGGAAGQCVRGRRGCVAQGDRPLRDREGEPLRLLDRAELPAGLGRADHEPPAGRQDPARGRHDLPPDPGDLAGRLGPRDHRELSRHRARRRALLQLSAQAAGQGLSPPRPRGRHRERTGAAAVSTLHRRHTGLEEDEQLQPICGERLPAELQTG